VKLRLKKQNRYKSFTLVELLIVVVIIGILGGLGVTNYRKVVVKAKAGKARHAVSLIADAEKIYRVDNGSYVAVAADTVDATVGTDVTGINLAAVDNDSDFNYSVTAAGLIRADNPAPIGACAANTTISLNLVTGVWDIPGCYQ